MSRRQPAPIRSLVARWRVCGLAAVCLASCTGAPDWRELAPAGLSLRFAFPCRPDAAERRLTLAGAEVRWQLWSCTDDAQTFALASAVLADPTAVASVLEQLGQRARSNLGARVESDAAAVVPGMTPQPAARRWRLAGRLADHREVVEELAVFAYGARVYQATVIGRSPERAQVQRFFEQLQVVP